ncbi:MAG: hypothetical protein U0X73_09000 [Thermoanaerobaculia bacterium]
MAAPREQERELLALSPPPNPVLFPAEPVDRGREPVGILAARYEVVASLAPSRRVVTAPELH